MTEEEKKAIEYLKKHIIPYAEGGTYQFLINEVILNLIDKQQKEIEYLKGYTKVSGRVGGKTSE